MLTAFHDPGFAAPIGPHIMPMRKFALVADALRAAADIRIVTPEPVSEADLSRVHSREYIDAIKTGEPRGLAESQKFPWSRELFPSVCLTSGGCLAAGRQALRDGVAVAIASGFHHACADHGEGFCTFNGLVIALEAMRASGEIATAAVLDMDLHYGNGTAQLAETRPWLFTMSLYGNDYWQGQLFADVTEVHHPLGENVRSFPLPKGCDRATMLHAMGEALPQIAARKPDVLFYQAGADPYFEDPYSTLALDHDDLRARDVRVFEFAKAHAIPIAWVLAGGYTRDVGKVMRVHLNTFDAWREVHGG